MKDLLQYMTAMRREFHAWPELGYQEEETAKRIWKELLNMPALGIYGSVAKTGILAYLEGNEGGPTIGLRADMDGLPVPEKNDVIYKSKNEGISHACGHDGHMAMLLGCAKRLSEERDKINGKVIFIFQPAEEGLAGGRAMAESEAYAKHKPDKIFGLHLWNEYPVGTVLARPGMQQAASRQVTIVFEGSGGHAAYLYRTRDPRKAASVLESELESIPRELFPWHELPMIHAGYSNAGTAANVIPARAEIRCTIRAHAAHHLDLITDEIGRRAKLAAEMKRLPSYPTVTHTEGYIPVINDRDETARVLSVARELGYRAQTMPPKPGADDFAFFLRDTPGCYFNVGSGNPAGGLDSPHHSPTFDFDEDALLVGCNMFYAIAKHYLFSKNSDDSHP